MMVSWIPAGGQALLVTLSIIQGRRAHLLSAGLLAPISGR